MMDESGFVYLLLTNPGGPKTYGSVGFGTPDPQHREQLWSGIFAQNVALTDKMISKPRMLSYSKLTTKSI
jgi:hypothetical protein